MKKRNLKMTALALALVGTLSVGGIMAYFTDGDTATNIFTVGKVSIDLQEPGWVPPTGITPEQEFKKDPQIKNDGINDVYVFMKVIVPYANVVTANHDGSKNAATDTELFSYDVKAGWIELTSEKVKDTTAKTVTHLYAYVGEDTKTMEAVAAGDTTGTLFDWIKFANVVEDQNLETKTLNVVVNAYGIQTTNINDGKEALDGNNADGKVAPQDVWDVLETQNPSLEVTVDEAVNTDIKK